jgi:hypothetical protein
MNRLASTCKQVSGFVVLRLFLEEVAMAVVISGVVYDASGNSVPNARVAFRSSPVAVPDIAALTDHSGAFALSAPAPGVYEIECVVEGFSPKAVSVQVTGRERVHVQINLTEL